MVSKNSQRPEIPIANEEKKVHWEIFASVNEMTVWKNGVDGGSRGGEGSEEEKYG